MATTKIGGPPGKTVIPRRWWFYLLLTLATLAALIAARVLGMPRGLRIRQEPNESSHPWHGDPPANPPAP